MCLWLKRRVVGRGSDIVVIGKKWKMELSINIFLGESGLKP